MNLSQNPDNKVIPGLDAIPQGNMLTWEIIEQADITQRGDVAPLDLGNFVRMPQLELKVWFLSINDLDLIVANPDQPREFFEPVRMSAQRTSMYEEGQKEAIKIAPCVDNTNLIRFIVIDGERRLRNLIEMKAPYIKFEVEYCANQRQLFETSFMYNDTRVEHTPMENARSFDKMVRWAMEMDGLSKDAAIAAIAKRFTKTVAFVKNHLKLLTFSPQVQAMVGSGVTLSSAILLGAAEKRYGADTSALRITRMILEHPDRELPVATRGVNVGKVSRKAVQELLASELVNGGSLSPEEGRKLKAAQAILDLASALHSVRTACNKVLDPTMIDAMVDALRSRRGSPPEVLYEDLDDALSLMRRFFGDVLKQALEAPKIVVPKGAPKFSQIIEQNSDRIKNDLRLQMLQVLIGESEEGEGRFITADEIHQKLADHKIVADVAMVANNLRILMTELPAGIIIDTMEVRKRSKVTKELDKKTGYRLDYRKGHYDTAEK